MPLQKSVKTWPASEHSQTMSRLWNFVSLPTLWKILEYWPGCEVSLNSGQAMYPWTLSLLRRILAPLWKKSMTEFLNYEHLYLSLTINTLKNSGYWCFSDDKMATPRRRYLAYSIAEVNIHRLTSYRGTEKRPDNLGRISCLCKNLLKLDQLAKTLKPCQGYGILNPCPRCGRSLSIGHAGCEVSLNSDQAMHPWTLSLLRRILAPLVRLWSILEYCLVCVENSQPEPGFEVSLNIVWVV